MANFIAEFFHNPFVTFFLTGFGTWVIVLIIASVLAMRAGLWMDKQIQDEQ